MKGEKVHTPILTCYNW